jgi:hypothetical protein
MMPYRHAAQQLIGVGEFRAGPLAHSPIGAAMLEAVRAIALQASRIEEGLRQGASHGGAEMKQALVALRTDVGGLNGRLQAFRSLTNTFFHDLSEVLTVISLHTSLVEEELGRPMSASFTRVQSSLSAIKATAIYLQALATGADRRQARDPTPASSGPIGLAEVTIALPQGGGQRQRINMSRTTDGDDHGETDERAGPRLDAHPGDPDQPNAPGTDGTDAQASTPHPAVARGRRRKARGHPH